MKLSSCWLAASRYASLGASFFLPEGVRRACWMHPSVPAKWSCWQPARPPAR